MKWSGPRTLVGWLNFLVLQWFGVRLARVTLPPGVKVYRATRAVRTGQIVTAADVVDDIEKNARSEWWTLLRWVWPLTGWWSDYRWIARVR